MLNCHILFLLICLISSIIHGMEKTEYTKYQFFLEALRIGNSEKLTDSIQNKNFDPHFHIHTSIGEMDAFAYLLLQTFPDESKTCHLADILLNANIPITLPTEIEGFTVFHHVKSKFMFDYFIKKANITDPKNLLDTYYDNGKETLFLKLAIQTVPFEEIEKIYNTYKPNLDFQITANGTILHHLLAFFLLYNLEAQLYHAIPVQKIADITSESLFIQKQKYSFVEETFNKFKFFAEIGNIDPLARNKYNQTPYQFYFSLQKELQKNNLSDYIKEYPEYKTLIEHLLFLKTSYESININLEKFYNDNFSLAISINAYKTTEEDKIMHLNGITVKITKRKNT